MTLEQQLGLLSSGDFMGPGAVGTTNFKNVKADASATDSKEQEKIKWLEKRGVERSRGRNLELYESLSKNT